MDADLAHIAGTLALVTNDSRAGQKTTPASRKTGSSGTGNWVWTFVIEEEPDGRLV